VEPTEQASPNPYAPPAAPWEPGATHGAVAGYSSLGGLATAVVVVMGLFALVELAAIANDLITIRAMSQLLARSEADRAALARIDVANALTLAATVGLKLAAAVLFCILMPRANHNARLFRRMGLTFSPGMSAGCFFVPVVSLWFPFKAMKELWLASEPDPDPRVDPRTAEIPLLIPLWWGAFLLHVFGTQVITMVGNPDAQGLIKRSCLAIFVSLISIAAAYLAAAVVRALARRQDQCSAAIARAASPVTRP
jgi:hypothetical protein